MDQNAVKNYTKVLNYNAFSCEQNAQESGHGSLVSPDGDQYIGACFNGLPHGQGRTIFAKGRYTFVNGDHEEGPYTNGLEHGRFTYTFANGEHNENLYINGVKDKGENLSSYWQD